MGRWVSKDPVLFGGGQANSYTYVGNEDERCSSCDGCTDADVLDKMAYTIANPTSAMLVESPDEWPGVLSHWTRPRTDVEMPDVFFDQSGSLPKKIGLDLVRPQIFPQLTDEQLTRALVEEVESCGKRTRAAAVEAGSLFVGAEAVLNQSFESKPSTEEPLGTLNPRIAASSPGVRVRVIQEMQHFVKAYRAAWHRWRDGFRDVLFPAGTYALRLYSGVPCAPC